MRELITSNNRLTLWLRWIFANALAELLGLGTTFAVGYLIYAVLFANMTGLLAALGSFLLMVGPAASKGQSSAWRSGGRCAGFFLQLLATHG